MESTVESTSQTLVLRYSARDAMFGLFRPDYLINIPVYFLINLVEPEVHKNTYYWSANFFVYSVNERPSYYY